MTRYSDEFKYSIIKRMMPPNNESVNSEVGNIPHPDLIRSGGTMC